MEDLIITFFTSTRQHYNLTDVDEISIKDTLSKSRIIRQSSKILHIKTIPGQEEIARIKKQTFKNLGFRCIETVGDWKNDDQSHGNGLLRDMHKIYSDNYVLSHKYVFHLENDWIFNTENLDLHIQDGISQFDKYENLIYYRDSRIDQKETIVRRLAAAPHQYKYITNREFSFNPFIARTQQIASILHLVNTQNIHPHCEMACELAARYLYPNSVFMFNNSGIVQHIGSPKEYNEYIDNQ